MAQLGARLNGIQEVRGSIPLSSTNLKGLSDFRLALFLLEWAVIVPLAELVGFRSEAQRLGLMFGSKEEQGRGIASVLEIVCFA